MHYIVINFHKFNNNKLYREMSWGLNPQPPAIPTLHCTPLFENFFSEVMSGLSVGACTAKLKSIARDVLELLTFNGQKFKVSRDPGV